MAFELCHAATFIETDPAAILPGTAPAYYVPGPRVSAARDGHAHHHHAVVHRDGAGHEGTAGHPWKCPRRGSHPSASPQGAGDRRIERVRGGRNRAAVCLRVPVAVPGARNRAPGGVARRPGLDRELASDEPMKSAEGAALGEDMKEWEWEADREAWEVEAAPELEDEAEVEHEDWEYERLDLGHEFEEEEELAAGPYELAYVEPEDQAAVIGDRLGLSRTSADLARREWEAWAGRGTRRETDPAMRETLLGYWETVLTDRRRSAPSGTGDSGAQCSSHTSLRHAGAGTAFTYAAAHYLYAAAAKRARRSNDTAKFRAFGITEVKPEIGDIVCRDWDTKPGQCGGTTYDNVDDGRYHPTHTATS